MKNKSNKLFILGFISLIIVTIFSKVFASANVASSFVGQTPTQSGQTTQATQATQVTQTQEAPSANQPTSIQQQTQIPSQQQTGQQQSTQQQTQALTSQNLAQSQVNSNAVAGVQTSNNETLGKTNSTIVQSVNDINDTSSESGMGFNVALNIILIAVGFVLILLAIAILIRVR